MENDILLKLNNLSVHYGGVKALDEVDINIDEGEMVVLMGPNGAGKSTVLKAIFGLAPIKSGQILWHESPVDPIPYQMASLGIAFVPQGRRVFASLSVRDNLSMGAFNIRDKEELARRTEEALEIFPVLKKKLKKLSGTLSGGEQQMLALARGLMIEPKILLLDEPSLGLSPKFVKEVFFKIAEINNRHKTAILVVEHNIKSILDIVKRAYILDKGRVVADGLTTTLLESDILERVFMGKL